MKIALLPKHRDRKPWAFNDKINVLPMTASLPFWQSRERHGAYVHRVRSGVLHLYDGKPSHAAFGLWCGMSGLSSNGSILAAPGPHEVMCATCEGRAIGAGLVGAPIIAGRPVKFSPRARRRPNTIVTIRQRSMLLAGFGR